jgi:GNAT superfamily N-acetyltransferase
MRLVEVAGLSLPQRARAREIYEANFPVAIRAPFESLAEDRVLAFADDEVRGLAVVRTLPSTGWAFLRYFVVGEQGRGLGGQFWDALCELCRDTGRIVLDVEHPDEPGIDADEVDQRRRRIRFYEQHGVQALPVRRYRPPHNGHEPPMLLLARNLGTDPTDPFDPDEVRRIVLAAYQDRYGLAADDVIVTSTLAASNL